MSMGLNNVSFSYGDTTIVRDFTWELPKRGVLCLWGPSGCGKTTLLRLLARLEQPKSGTVVVPERVSMVFQEDRLLPWLTALENVTLCGVEASAAQEMLSALGLTKEETGALPSALSGGQQRRVALARALAADSDLLLLDEPFNGLDETTWRTVVPLVQRYAADRPVVLVTHVRQQAQALDATLLVPQGIPISELNEADFLQENSSFPLTNEDK